MTDICDRTPSLLQRLAAKSGKLCMQRIPHRRVESRRVGVMYFVFNRSGRMVWNCLKSLRSQTVPAHCVDITICDWGSTPEHEESLESLCREFQCRLIRLNRHNDQVWNKSYAYNVMIRQTPEDIDYLAGTDIDLVYAPNWIEQLIRANLWFRNPFVMCQAREILEADAELLETRDPVDDFDVLRAKSVPRTGTGMCLCASRDWFFKIHGWDERYRFWGHQDNDIRKRARLDGLREVWISDVTTMIHQWHTTKWDLREGEDADLAERIRSRQEANRQLYHDSNDVVRNSDDWGVMGRCCEVVDVST